MISSCLDLKSDNFNQSFKIFTDKNIITQEKKTTENV